MSRMQVSFLRIEIGCKKDIRIIWTKNIVAVDTSELENARRELTEERSARHEIEAEKARLQLAFQMGKLEMTRMEREIDDLRKLNSTRLMQQINKYQETSKHLLRAQSTNGSYVIGGLVTISTEPQAARVMSFNPHYEMLIVDKSMLGSGSGTAGLLKISLRETSSQEYVPVHCKSVRDVQCSPTGSGLILTTSLDKTLKLTSTVGSNSIVQSFELDSPGWSCSWKDDDTNYMFCGLANGTVLMFDIRSTKGPVARLQYGRKPIHSMTYIAQSNEARVSGLIAGSFDYVFLWNAAGNGDIGLYENNEITQHSKLDVQVSGASCYSVSYDQTTQQVLASFRGASFTRHVVSALNTTDDGLPTLHEMRVHSGKSGQKSMARTFIFSRQQPNEIKTYICSGDEDSCSLSIWGPEGEVQLERQMNWGKECVIDVKRCVQLSGKDIIAGLTERHVRLYSYQ
ncbi:WD40-repeat-containing domain protein [Endogone sp. FLAS-F59071]|nr:WD40-repeat-containing domain protein [Endogone sp. FLAS-F59071]|eukprot:RUS21578.1 WD40-repeat-containing domain protein [Endogone sp. FLAS-F59071]